MNRIVLVSDPTEEFRNNTTSSFKVRLPVPLELKGEGWKVGLAAISTPDAGLDLSRLSDGLKNYVFMIYTNTVTTLSDLSSWYRHLSTVTIDDITGDPSITDGVSLMKALIFKTQREAFQQVQTKSKRLYLKYQPRYKWEGEELVMLPLKHDDIVLIQTSSDYAWAAWKVHTSMAMKMKWLVQKKDKSYVLGPNLRYEVPLVTSAQGDYYNQVPNTEFANHDVWKIEESHLRLSLCFQWRFINLNVAFREVVGEPSRTFLVYSDLVDSNIVGGQQHAMVREVEYRRQNKGVSYYEPLHIQWLPCRREYMDVVEVEIAESHGGLVKFGGGRTLITFVFKRDV